jgi:hypothetical protein
MGMRMIGLNLHDLLAFLTAVMALRRQAADRK